MILPIRKSLLAALALAGLGVAASAQVISVNFSAASPPYGFGPFYLLGASDVAGVVPADNWNNVTITSGTVSSLLDDSGSTTTASVSPSSSAGTYGHWGFYSASGNDQRMLGGFLEAPFDTFSLSISAVPYALYDLYVYCGPNSDRIGNDWNVTLGSTTIYGIVGDPGALLDPPFIEATATTPGGAVTSNYVKFSSVSASDVTLSFAGTAPSLSGIQMVLVPEPSTALLGLVGVLGIAGRRRRRA